MDAPRRPSMEEVEALIVELLFEWFPSLKHIVRHGGYVFGGILREMWVAARSYDPYKSLSLRDTIRHHIFFYFRDGGDVDIAVTYQLFHEASGIELYNSEYNSDTVIYDHTEKRRFHMPEEFTQIERIETVVTGYEFARIVKNINAERNHEIRDYYGSREELEKEMSDTWYKISSADAESRKILESRLAQLKKLNDTATTSEIFPVQHFVASVRTDVCAELGAAQLVKMDIIRYQRLQPDDIEHCDFGCNTLFLQYNDKFELTFKPNYSNCSSKADFDQQVTEHRLTVLKTEKPHKSIKLINRLADRLRSGWTISRDTCTMEVLTKNFIDAVTTRDNWSFRDNLPEAMIKVDEKLISFIQAMSDEIFTIFLACRGQISVTLIKWQKLHLASDHRRKDDFVSYRVDDVLRFIQELAIRHGQYPQFLIWVKSVPYWDPSTYHSTCLRITAEHRPQDIPQMYKLCKFQTNKEALEFPVILMTFDREAEFRHFLSMGDGKRLIKLYNKRNEDDRRSYELFSGFFRDAQDLTDYKPFNPKYLRILHEHGLRLPRPKTVVHCSTELISFLWDIRLIGKSALFPTKDDTDKWAREPDVIHPTASNMRWLMSTESVHLKRKDVERLAIQFNRWMNTNPDIGFLAEYKAYCTSHRIQPDAFERLFCEPYLKGDVAAMRHYFMYRFDTHYPEIEQVSRLYVINNRSYSTTAGFLCSYEGSFHLDTYMYLARHYGPPVALAALRHAQHPGDREYRIVTLFYWFWRISKREEDPIPAAIRIPRDVLKIIVEYCYCTSDITSDNYGINWHDKEWRTFRHRNFKCKYKYPKQCKYHSYW